MIIPGTARGLALASDQPLSFWGGYDHQTGEITDRRHPLSGQIARDKILVLPYSRGSSTTTAVLLEALRAGTAPAAIVNNVTDTFFALAIVAAQELYSVSIPLVRIRPGEMATLESGTRLEIRRDGTIIARGPE